MKKLLLSVAVIALLGSCAEKSKSISGVVFDASMNTVTIINGTDTMYFGTEDAQREIVPSSCVCSVVEGLEIGADVQIFYTGKLLEGERVQTCPVTRMLITPISIVGSWVEPIPGMEGVQGFKLTSDGVATSINMATLLYNSWTLDNGTLYLSGQSIGNGQTIDVNDVWTVETLSADSLILTGANLPTARYARMK